MRRIIFKARGPGFGKNGLRWVLTSFRKRFGRFCLPPPDFQVIYARQMDYQVDFFVIYPYCVYFSPVIFYGSAGKSLGS